MAYEFPYFGGTPMYHTGDLAFWFYSLGNVRYQIAGDEENAYKVADFAAKALANFCATGDPTVEGYDRWLPHEADNAHCMIVDTDSRLVNGDYGAEIIDLMTVIPHYSSYTEVTLGGNGNNVVPENVNLEHLFIRSRSNWSGNTYAPVNAEDIDVESRVFSGALSNNQTLVEGIVNPDWDESRAGS